MLIKDLLEQVGTIGTVGQVPGVTSTAMPTQQPTMQGNTAALSDPKMQAANLAKQKQDVAKQKKQIQDQIAMLQKQLQSLNNPV